MVEHRDRTHQIRRSHFAQLVRPQMQNVADLVAVVRDRVTADLAEPLVELRPELFAFPVFDAAFKGQPVRDSSTGCGVKSKGTSSASSVSPTIVIAAPSNGASASSSAT